jgi:hypothetical protein
MFADRNVLSSVSRLDSISFHLHFIKPNLQLRAIVWFSHHVMKRARKGYEARQLPILSAFNACFLIEFDDDPTIVMLAHLEHIVVGVDHLGFGE